MCRGWVVFAGLRDQLVAQSPPQALPIDVLNGMPFLNLAMDFDILKFGQWHTCVCAAGIAWDNAGRRLFITGKCWPKLYEIKPQVIKLEMLPAEHLQVQQMCRVSL